MDYFQQNGTNPIRKWYDKELSPNEQARMDSLLTTLERTQIWQVPQYKALSGAQIGLGEIRWKGDQGRQIRLVGFRGVDPGQFTLLIGCTKKSSNYEPRSALETAVTRMSDLKRGIGKTHEHENESDQET